MMAGMTEPLMIYRAVGCKACNGTGVVGRTAIFEMIPITEELRTMINDRASDPELRACARRDGARSLFQDGFRSEEHTSELQSHHDLVCRLLLEKKKKKKKDIYTKQKKEQEKLYHITNNNKKL